jgi:hypothetical protein
MTDAELRMVEGLQLRADTDEKKRVLRGMAVPYDKPAVIAARFVEQIAARCFSKSIVEAARRLPLMARHSLDTWPLGSADEWDDRDDGLHAQWTLADTEQAREAWELVAAGHLSGLSVGFMPVRSDWTLAEPPELDQVIRREARLVEVSLVPVGSYADARVMVRTGEGRTKGTPRVDRWTKWFGDAREPAVHL